MVHLSVYMLITPGNLTVGSMSTSSCIFFLQVVLFPASFVTNISELEEGMSEELHESTSGEEGSRSGSAGTEGFDEHCRQILYRCCFLLLAVSPAVKEDEDIFSKTSRDSSLLRTTRTRSMGSSVYSLLFVLKINFLF